MPIYEYKCSECGQTLEILQRMSDPELDKYDGCDNPKCCLEKVPSTYGMSFVGSGFYITDYKNK